MKKYSENTEDKISMQWWVQCQIYRLTSLRNKENVRPQPEEERIKFELNTVFSDLLQIDEPLAVICYGALNKGENRGQYDASLKKIYTIIKNVSTSYDSLLKYNALASLVFGEDLLDCMLEDHKSSSPFSENEEDNKIIARTFKAICAEVRDKPTASRTMLVFLKHFHRIHFKDSIEKIAAWITTYPDYISKELRSDFLKKLLIPELLRLDSLRISQCTYTNCFEELVEGGWCTGDNIIEIFESAKATLHISCSFPEKMSSQLFSPDILISCFKRDSSFFGDIIDIVSTCASERVQ